MVKLIFSLSFFERVKDFRQLKKNMADGQPKQTFRCNSGKSAERIESLKFCALVAKKELSGRFDHNSLSLWFRLCGVHHLKLPLFFDAAP